MSNNEKSGKNLQALRFRAKDADDEDECDTKSIQAIKRIAKDTPCRLVNHPTKQCDWISQGRVSRVLVHATGTHTEASRKYQTFSSGHRAPIP